MRFRLLAVVGLLATACGLSMNPDLPSAKSDEAPGFTGDGDIALGDGDGDGVNSPAGGANSGAGGSRSECVAFGGLGGSSASGVCEDGQ